MVNSLNDNMNLETLKIKNRKDYFFIILDNSTLHIYVWNRS